MINQLGWGGEDHLGKGAEYIKDLKTSKIDNWALSIYFTYGYT